MRQDPVVHLSPNKQGHSDSHYSSHSSSNTLSSNASSAHSDEKWYDSGERTESELNSYNYLQGTSADSGIDTTSYGPSHGSTASLGAATSPRTGLTKEKVAPLWHSSSEVVSIADRTLEKDSHMDRKTESSLSLDIHSKSQPASSPLTRENSAYSLSDAVSHTSTMSSRHSASPVVFTSARSSPKEELHPATSPQLAPSFSSSSSSSSGPRTFYPRQGATSKYLIGWKKPEGTINSVGFMDSRK